MFSDDFGGASLDPCWSKLNGTPQAPLIDIAVSGGSLHLKAIPGQAGVWYQGSTKSLVYKLVAGDFKVTTIARPRKRTDANAAPTIALHVGGLMARDPASNGGNSENYVFIMAGSNEGAQPGIEVKSTTAGASVFSEPTWSDPLAAELRICRLGATFSLLKRKVGDATWTLQDAKGQPATIARPDLPATLQLGLAVNFSGPTNDLDLGFDAVTLGPTPKTAADCTN